MRYIATIDKAQTRHAIYAEHPAYFSDILHILILAYVLPRFHADSNFLF